MGKRSIRGQANMLLALSAAGILAAFPFQQTFGGGLIFAACSAATIGGLADSFAISALFGNPLQIGWPSWMGTHIISRNRERLIGELVDMVEKELLTVEAIRDTVDDLNLSEVVIRYLTEHGGSANAKELAAKLAGDLLGKVNAEELASGIQSFVSERAGTIQIADLIADVADWSVKNSYDERVITFFAEQFARLAGSTQFRELIEKFAATAIRSYEGDKFRRRLVDFTAGLNAHAISVRVQEWIVRFLEQFRQEDHPQRDMLRGKIAEFVTRLREDEELRLKVEEGKQKLLSAAEGNLRFDEFLASRLDSLRNKLLGQDIREEQTETPPVKWLHDQIDKAIQRFAGDRELQSSIDGMIKKSLLSWIEQKHAMIGLMVKEKLSAFSEVDLIELVKDKAGKDLQYIRLNGMIVGACVGILLFFVTFWIGGGET
ncbi:DUF445 domain-containing protein [Paenibacillus sp. LHD-117]|uniref:DUF445 domain-containing protein n=1 Tax=Paenibacillus sp. LHD-117 TaxID=3071412 RepID=UPI0027E1ACE4|nr:DUF445 domain-containing protein [Paenibacillus sp. LHD-117]MDQ6418531.1 DUF445 domain-containing protein [Paenibacillus sp. LHD-117]